MGKGIVTSWLTKDWNSFNRIMWSVLARELFNRHIFPNEKFLRYWKDLLKIDGWLNLCYTTSLSSRKIILMTFQLSIIIIITSWERDRAPTIHCISLWTCNPYSVSLQKERTCPEWVALISQIFRKWVPNTWCFKLANMGQVVRRWIVRDPCPVMMGTRSRSSLLLLPHMHRANPGRCPGPE